MTKQERNKNGEEGLEADGSREIVVPHTEIERIDDAVIDSLIELLSKPTQALTPEEYLDSIAKRQKAVDQHLIIGGADTLRRFFERIRQLEKKQPVRIDLSMLELIGKLLGGLYLPGANLEKLILTETDITGSNLEAANLNAAVANGAIMRGVVATGADFTDAVMPHADLSGARIIGGTFVNTVMTNVIVDEETNFAGARFIGTYLGGTDIAAANLTGAIFRGIRR